MLWPMLSTQVLPFGGRGCASWSSLELLEPMHAFPCMLEGVSTYALPYCAGLGLPLEQGADGHHVIPNPSPIFRRREHLEK